MKKTSFPRNSGISYPLIGGLIGMVLLYLWLSLASFRGFRFSQDLQKHKDIRLPSQAEHATPESQFLLGSRFYQLNDLDNAAYWVKKSLLRDPANPDYYYKLAQISQDMEVCVSASPKKEKCPVTRYLLAAWQNDPQEDHLRAQVARWLYATDQDAAFEFIQKRLADDTHILIVPSPQPSPFTDFLEEIHFPL